MALHDDSDAYLWEQAQFVNNDTVGVVVENSHALVEDVNISTNFGGGMVIVAGGRAEVGGTTLISGNFGGSGGGVLVTGPLSALEIRDDVEIRDNWAFASGGGLAVMDQASALVEGPVVVSGNRAVLQGGGIFVHTNPGLATPSTLDLVGTPWNHRTTPSNPSDEEAPTDGLRVEGNVSAGAEAGSWSRRARSGCCGPSWRTMPGSTGSAWAARRPAAAAGSRSWRGAGSGPSTP